MADLSEMTVGALKIRQALGREICRKLRNEWREEEGAVEALKHYEGSVKRYTEELARRRKVARAAEGTEKPDTVSIDVKTAQLGAKTK